MLQFKYTILYVPDVRRAVAFYEKAFGFPLKFITPEEDYAEIITGNTCIAFAKSEMVQSFLNGGFEESTIETKPFGIELGFVADDVEAAFNQALDNGATLVNKPEFKPHGQTVSYVRDINGFLIEICSVMG
jgi:lactoylglutathione lyase